MFNGLRSIVKTGAQWRLMPHDLPPRESAYQQAHRWPQAGCFEAIVHDLRVMLRLAAERNARPSVANSDCQTLQSTPEYGERAG